MLQPPRQQSADFNRCQHSSSTCLSFANPLCRSRLGCLQFNLQPDVQLSFLNPEKPPHSLRL